MNPLILLWLGASFIYLATANRISDILTVIGSIGQPKAAVKPDTTTTQPGEPGAPAATPPPPIINT